MKSAPVTRIEICPSHGHIVAVCTEFDKHTLRNYTVNGVFIREVAVSSEPTSICSFSSANGFDYFAITHTDRVVIVYDAFTLDAVKTVCKHSVSLTYSVYSASHASLIVGAEDGALIMAQCQLD